jgi:hypothetical protein
MATQPMTMQERRDSLHRRLAEEDKESFRNWRDHPVTVLVFEWLELQKDSLKERSLEGEFMGPSFQECAIRQALAQGQFQAYNSITGIEYLDLSGVKDGKQ